MRNFYGRFLSQSLTQYSKSIPQSQVHALRYPLINYPKTHVPKPPFSSSKLSNFTTTGAQELNPPPPQTERVSAVVDELSGLTLLEVMDLNELLRQKLGIESMPAIAVMRPGMGFTVAAGGAKGGGGPAAGAEEKVEKKAFDLKLDGGFDPSKKITIIKEIRALVSLGLKEAKELVEKAPISFKKGVTKEEAEEIVKKMATAGATVTIE